MMEEISQELLNLLQHQITEKSRLPEMAFLFSISGTPCFPKGELVAVTGKAKSGKTLFLSILMAVADGGEMMSIKTEKPLRVMWFDTEQSAQSTQDILVNRIKRMKPDRQTDETLWAFNVRDLGWEARKQLFIEGIRYCKPDLVILDGVRDLISDINDGVEAQQITDQLMQVASAFNCCIVCVLHQNKSDGDRNLRGWIGTEMTNKVFEVYACEKLRESSTFKVEQTMTRKHEVERALYYTVDRESGLPSACDKPTEQPRDDRGRFTSIKSERAVKREDFNQRYINYSEEGGGNWSWNLSRLFADALEGRQRRKFAEVMAVAMKLSHIQEKSYYYARLQEAIDQHVICKDKDYIYLYIAP